MGQTDKRCPLCLATLEGIDGIYGEELHAYLETGGHFAGCPRKPFRATPGVMISPWYKRLWRWIRADKYERRHRAGTLTIPSPKGSLRVPSDRRLREALHEHPPTEE